MKLFFSSTAAILLLVILSGLGLPALLVGQTKYEKEFRLKEEEVPARALDFVRSFPYDGKLKWYFEQNLEGNSVEAKFKYRGNRYSVEFDTLGALQDIEVEVRTRDLPQEVLRAIQIDLDSTYQKHKLRKIQVQFRGSIPDLNTFMATLEPDRVYELRYEVVAKGRRDKWWNLYEIHYDSDGQALDRSRVMLRNTDNIEF